MTLLILVILINLKMGETTDNGITYLLNDFTYKSKLNIYIYMCVCVCV